MKRRVPSLGLIGIVLFSVTSVAEEFSGAKVGRAPGALAVRAGAAGGWRLVGEGDRLPEECVLESGLAPACRIDLPGGALDVAADTRLRLKLPARSVTLESGRIFLVTAAGPANPWSAAAAGIQIALAPSSAAEVTLEPDQRLALCVTQGSAMVAAPGMSRISLAAGFQWRWNPVEKRSASQALAAERKARIEAWTRHGLSQGLGQLLVRDAQSRSPVRLNVARYHVHLVLQPPVALVQIDQSFYNPIERQEEGTFVFNLPPRASVSRFAMYVTPQQLIEGELIERERAAQIYQSIVDWRRDPAILEQIGSNLFRMRVFPIFARDTKRILLDYTVPLETLGGVCRFQLPLVSDLQPIWDFRVSGAIRGAVGAKTAASPSHPGLDFQACRDGTIQFDLRRNNYRPQNDFSLTFATADDGQARLRSYVAEPLPTRSAERGAEPPGAGQPNRAQDEWTGQPATYFMVSLPPERVAPREPPPADVLILADTSASMRKVKLMRQAVRAIVRHLRPVDRMRLMSADVAARPLHVGWLVPGSGEARAAMACFDREFCLGGTDLAVCLRDAFRQFPARSPRRRLVVYVGDGEASLFDTSPASPDGNWSRLPDQLRQAGVSLSGVIVRRTAEGTRHWESLSRQVGGQVFDLAGKAGADRQLLAWLLAGLPEPVQVLDVKIDGAAPADVFYPPACLPGQTLHILGRCRATARQIRLDLTRACGARPQTQTWQLPLDAKQVDVFVGRLWAQERLDRLQAGHPQTKADQDALRQQIVGLSHEWSLLSRHTAFLVLESEDQYRQYQVDRSQRRRYWKPADARPQPPLPDDWLASVVAAAEKERQRVEAEQLAEAIRQARAALAAGDPREAMTRLASRSRSPLAAKSAEYVDLRLQLQRAVAERTLPERLGWYRGLFDPASPAPQATLVRSLSQLLSGSAEVNPEFARRHPYARQLLTEVPLRWPKPGRVRPTLGDLVEQLKGVTGGNVMLDDKALAGAGVSEDSEFVLYGTGKISLRSYARAALRQLNLVLLEEPYRLLITTAEKADSTLFPEVIPVADLLFTDRTAAPVLLVDPYADRQQQAADRIRSKLKRPISLSFVKKPLGRVLADLSAQLSENLLVDHKALRDVGVELDTPATDNWRHRKRLDDDPFADDDADDPPPRARGARKSKRSDDDPFGDDDAGRRPRRARGTRTAKSVVKTDALVTADWHGVPAKESLQWLLNPMDLTYIIRDEAIVVTTPEQADNHTTVRVHSVRGILYAWPIPEGATGESLQNAGWNRGRHGWRGGAGGGMGGSMGGMGGGMFGSGMGGMAGMGGGMGGMGPAGGAPSSGPAIPAERAGVSSDGDDSDPVTPAASAAPSGGGGAALADFDSPIDLITSTIRPTSWDSAGGPGSIGPFEPTLDLVFLQTDEAHEEVADLLQRLRRLPPAIDARSTFRTAEVRPATTHDQAARYLDDLIALITSTVRPTTWDSAGGPGSIAPEGPRLALVTSATAEVHDEISCLLTQLRRSRYAALRPDRPWELAGGTSPLAPFDTQSFGPAADPRPPHLPPPRPEELKLLALRRVPAEGAWTWRRSAADPVDTLMVRVQRAAERMEVQVPHGVARIEGDRAAVAWPGLALVEHGDWGEAVRRLLDVCLPWLPHRSNEELAGLFSVQTVPTSAGQAGGAACLRLVPRGLADRADTYLLVRFSHQSGLPQTWESYLKGKLTGRLRFAGPPDGWAGSGWHSVALEDAAGKTLLRWELVEARSGAGPIPDLTAGWEGCVQLDRQGDGAIVDREFRQVMTSIGKRDWPSAVRQLEPALAAHPQHPFLLLARAWCYEHDRTGNRAAILAGLRRAAASQAADLARFVGEKKLTWLEPRERYEILLARPEALRGAADWEHLARAAAESGLWKEALEHLEKALATPVLDARRFPCERLRVEVLFRLNRLEDAIRAARRWSSRPGASAEQLASMAELLADCRQVACADELFRQGLDRPGLPADERFGLLWRRAAIHRGRPRWQILLEAATVVPAGSPARQRTMSALTSELNDAEYAPDAGALAQGTGDPQLRAQLRLRQAELSSAPSEAADLLWGLYQDRRLPEDRLEWAGSTWNRAGQPQRTIEAIEAWFRAEGEFPPAVLPQLADAYRAAGRAADARRATTSDELSPASPTNSTPGRSPSGGGMF
jgi:hypothetical protein